MGERFAPMDGGIDKREIPHAHACGISPEKLLTICMAYVIHAQSAKPEARTASNPPFRSSMMSSMYSVPIDRRIVP